MARQSYVYGTEQQDNLHTGGAYLDYVYGYGGSDRLYGDEGKDRLFGGQGNDTLFGEGGFDKLYGDEGNDKLYGDAGDDWLDGGSGDDQLMGGTGDDELSGGAGDDWLYGGSGDDVFQDYANFHSGNDTYYGGSGADYFHLTGTVDGVQHDKIMDFEVGVDNLAIGTWGYEFIVEPDETGSNTVIFYTGTLNYGNASTNTYELIPVSGDVTLVGVDISDFDYSVGNGLYA
ncbi:calcium-binding protein [Marinomonas gallaica]|uniref:calcium-binding protein n=1 Tax=Marinomonas gallaica TaxID=1806667 RepID=UPI003A947A54